MLQSLSSILVDRSSLSIIYRFDIKHKHVIFIQVWKGNTETRFGHLISLLKYFDAFDERIACHDPRPH